MNVMVPPPQWPADPDHREAIDTLLDMAAAEARWDEPRRAVTLLDSVEQIVGVLPEPYDRMRARCHGAATSPTPV